MDFRDRTKALIGKRGLNAFSLAREIGVGRTVISEMLEGRSKHPRLDTLQKMAQGLGTSVAYLIGETDDPEPAAPLRSPKASLLTVLDAVEVLPTPRGRVWAQVPTEDGMIGLLLTGPQALDMAKNLERAEGRAAVSSSACAGVSL